MLLSLENSFSIPENRPDTGQFMMSEIRLGSRGDSYYEYLLKQYLQTVRDELWSVCAANLYSPRTDKSASTEM